MTRSEINERDLGKLVERVREAAGALMQGDVRRYFALVNEALTSRSCRRPVVRRGTGPTHPQVHVKQ